MDLTWRAITSKVLWRGRFPVVEDRLRAAHDGREHDYTYLGITRAAVLVLALDDDGRVICVRQYRHPIGRVTLELPAGHLDAGEAPEAAAHREFEEETGMTLGHLQPLGTFTPVPALTAFQMHMFFGADLRPGIQNLDASELLDVVRVPLAELHRDVLAGRHEVVGLSHTILLAAAKGLLPR